jgi:hypothetical protein
MTKKMIVLLTALSAVLCGNAYSQEQIVIDESGQIPVIADRIAVDRVWAGHPVGFFLMTKAERQYIAYYNSDRRMMVGMRSLSDEQFKLLEMKSKKDGPPEYKVDQSSTILGWDSHNYITMTLDKEGYVHLSGNMHCNRLTYFRTLKPYDISAFEQVDEMVGRNEMRCTYPKFMDGPGGRLMFHYRDGSSGSGSEIYNTYYEKAKTWKRLLDKPLTDGKGEMNAYINGPYKGPDGCYHISWVWRDTPDCSTNHDLSYACSPDMINWQTAAGNPVKLPITIKTPGVIVDPIPVNGGIINGTGQVGFDADGRAVLSYHKFDENGNTQIYAARFEDSAWKIRQLTDWDFRWYFSGGGSIEFEVRAGRVTAREDGFLELDYSAREYGSGCWLLDNDTLKIAGKVIKGRDLPSELGRLESDFPGMGVRWAADSGETGEDKKYFLRWETLGRNRDRPRKGPLPEPSELVLYMIKYN